MFLYEKRSFLNNILSVFEYVVDCVPGEQWFRSQRTGDASGSVAHRKSGRAIHPELLSRCVRKPTRADGTGVGQVRQRIRRPFHSPRDVPGRVQRHLGREKVQGLAGTDTKVLRMRQRPLPGGRQVLRTAGGPFLVFDTPRQGGRIFRGVHSGLTNKSHAYCGSSEVNHQ